MTAFDAQAEQRFPVLWNDGSYNGWCPWCDERIRQALASQSKSIEVSLAELGTTIEKRLAEIKRLRDALLECLDYFEDRADADHNGHNFVPNEEMVLAQLIKQALGQ